MIIKNKKAFTLLELMIAISIMAILMMMAYAPYNYYSNKAKVRITAKEISQILYESRNLAIHGLDTGSWNLSIWVYFDTSDTTKDLVKVFAFPYTYTWAQILPDLSDENIKIYKTYKLLDWMQVDKIWEQNNWLFFFSAVSGNWNYFYYTPLKTDLLGDSIEIDFSYKW